MIHWISLQKENSSATLLRLAEIFLRLIECPQYPIRRVLENGLDIKGVIVRSFSKTFNEHDKSTIESVAPRL